ncbi:MAG: LLM class F420-dependent oxidoreductase [Acidimicrobiia bacterium]
MRFSIGLPTDRVEHSDEFVTGESVMECAVTLEAMGFDACFVTDHPAPDAKWLAAGGHHALDPMVALAFAAAATSRLMLQTHVMVLAYRNPLLTAKAVLSLDALSNGRVILGVAAGYLKPEFAALGVDFDERNELTDEAIDVIRLALTTDALEFEGRHFRSRATTLRPRTERGVAPIWIGGNSRAAIRRAVDRGDGWVPFPNPARAARAVRTPLLATIEDLTERLAYMRDYAAERDRAVPADVCFHPFSLAHDYDAAAVRSELDQLEALGVTWCAMSAPPGSTRTEYLEGAGRLAADIMVARS